MLRIYLTGIVLVLVFVFCSPGSAATVNTLADIRALPVGTKSIEYYTSNLGDDGLKELSRFTNLNSLTISRALSSRGRATGPITISGISHIAALTSLESIGLDAMAFAVPLDDKAFKILSALKNPTHLTLAVDAKFNDAAMGHLSKFEKLEKLTIRGCTNIGDKGVTHLGKLKKLTKLWLLCRSERHAGSIKKSLDANANILLNFDGKTPNRKITGSTLGKLGALKELRHLWISHCPQLKGASMAAVLPKFKKLESLALDYCKRLDDSLFKGIKKLPELTSLSLASIGNMKGGGTAVTATGLAHLKDLKKLTHLDLEHCHGVDDKALKEIGQITSLVSLVLTSKSVTDKGLEHLYGLKNLTNLLYLVNMPQLTPAALEALRKALPKLTI